MVHEDAALLNRRVTHMTPAALFSRRLQEVMIPAGAWRGFDGKLYQGPAKLSLAIKDDELCYFEKAATTIQTVQK